MKEVQAKVTEEENGARVWRFVMSHWKTIVQSREHMRKSFKRGEITVNGQLSEVTKILCTDDEVAMKFDARVAHASVYGKEKLDVRYEDDELAVVVKPSGRTMVGFGYMLPFSLKPSPLQALASKNKDAEEYEIDLGDVEDDEDVEDEFVLPVNVSPTVGQQRIPCSIHGLEKASNGLILVAKTAEMRTRLLDMHRTGCIHRTFRVICHGSWEGITEGSLGSRDSHASIEPLDFPSPKSLTIDRSAVGSECLERITVVSVTPSNDAEFLTTLDVAPRSPFLGIHVRRYLVAQSHPVVGNSNNSKHLKANRDKGLCAALTNVEFIHPTSGDHIQIHMEEPKKFQQLRAREQLAFERRQQNDLAELKRGGLDTVAAYDRKAERPIAYLVGEKEFYNMRFKVSPATLIPRTSTETLVHAALDIIKARTGRDSTQRILDIGTGSGCLLLAILASTPDAIGTGVDISREALEIAKVNMDLHQLGDRAAFQYGDLGDLHGSMDLVQPYDVLVCNPPYLDSNRSTKIMAQFAGTEHEPAVALFASNGGYGAYELLATSLLRDIKAPHSRRLLAPEARVVLEIGSGMGKRVKEIFYFLEFESARNDQQDSERCLVFSLPKAGPSNTE